MNHETAEIRPPASPTSEHVAVGPDGFTYTADAPYAAAHRYLDAYLAVCMASGPESWEHQRLQRLLSEVERACGVRELPCPAIVCATLERMAWIHTNRPDAPEHGWADILYRLRSHLFYDRDCSQATYSPEQIDHLLRLLIASDQLMGNCWYQVLPLVERTVRQYPLTSERRRLVWAYVDAIVLTGMDYGLGPDDEHMLALARLDELTQHIPSGLMRAGEPWTDMALADVAAMPDAQRSGWENLLRHAMTATTSRPTKTWLRHASERIAPIGRQEVDDYLIRWFDAATRPATLPMHDWNATILRGLVWCCAQRDSDQLTQAIGPLGEAMFKKVGFYARCLKAGNACLYTLSMMPCVAAIAQLARLRLRVKGHRAQEAVQKALVAAADRAGQPHDEIEELVVPTFELGSDGRRRDAIDGYTAEFRQDPPGQRQHPDGAQRPVSVHRAGSARRRARQRPSIPTL